MTSARKAFLAFAAILAAAILAGAVYFGLHMRAGKVYSEKITEAQRYLTAGDYENAVLSYTAAIEAAPDDEEGYIGLSDVYVADGRQMLAIQTLQQGYGRTGSPRIKYLLDSLLLDDGGTPAQDAGDSEAALDASLLHALEAYSYEDYRARGGASAPSYSGDTAIVRADGLSAELHFANNETQPRALVSGDIGADSLPVEIVLDNIMDLFGGAESISRGGLESMGLQDLVFRVGADHSYTMTFIAGGCRISAEADAEGTLHAGAWNRIVPLAAVEGAPRQDGPDIRLFGAVTDARTGQKAADILLAFRSSGEEYGESVAETATDVDGAYSVQLSQGRYTVEISGDGYETLYKDVCIDGGERETEANFAISPTLAGGQARIVLEWGEEPRDLDGHLVGRTDQGSDIHISFRNPQEWGGDSLVAELDIDEVSGNGLETTTIYDLNGTYDYTVVDFGRTGNMSQQGASVTIYMPGESPETVHLGGDSGVQNVWEVCRIDHGKLEILNRAGSEEFDRGY